MFAAGGQPTHRSELFPRPLIADPSRQDVTSRHARERSRGFRQPKGEDNVLQTPAEEPDHASRPFHLARGLWALPCGVHRAGVACENLGEASASLVALDIDPGEEVLREKVGATGQALVDLVLAWDASVDASIPADLSPITAGDGLSWDGDTLNAAFAEGDTTYDVSLRYITDAMRSEIDGIDLSSIDPSLLGSGEFRGQAITMPPHLDDLFRLHTRVGDIDVHLEADYVSLSMNGDGCAAGGGVEISYMLDGEVLREGWVRVGFHGCGRVHVYERR